MGRAAVCLYVFLHGEMVGRLVPLRRGSVHLYYESDRPMPASPLSLSLPFGPRGRHDATSWVDGLLPENPRTRSRWARELGADSTDPYDLLCTQAGLECAGAVQFYWLIGNPDGHSKNYGLLLDGPRVRLAPLYDLNSLAPYVGRGTEAMRPAMRFEGRNPDTLNAWGQKAALFGIDITADELRDIADGLPRAFDRAAAHCPEWASESAQRVCEGIAAHTGRTVSGTQEAGSFYDLGRHPSPSAPVAPADARTCGKAVKRTGMPCLLRPGHNGRCRSVL